jgi:hypothetical protein
LCPSTSAPRDRVAAQRGDPDWDEITEIAEDSYRMIAPKRLAAQLDEHTAE